MLEDLSQLELIEEAEEDDEDEHDCAPDDECPPPTPIPLVLLLIFPLLNKQFPVLPEVEATDEIGEDDGEFE